MCTQRRRVIMSYTRVELGLFVIDALWNLCVLFPVLVLFWTGTWDLVDVYMDRLFPNQTLVSGGMSIVIGGIILISGYFVIPLLKEFVCPFSWRSLKHIVVSRICMYVCSVGNMFFWRGLWNTTLILVGIDPWILPAMAFIALLLVILLKSTVNCIGCPFGIHLDTSPDFYDTSPRFRQQMDTPFLYLLDVLFSVCIMHALTVLVWISLMTLCDHLIFPHDRWLSLVVSLGTGCGLSLVVFALMLPHRAAHRHLKVSNRPAAYVFGATFNVLTILAVLMLWRGLWGLIQELVTSGPNRVEADWICHALGFLGMVCLQVGIFFRGVGCDVDGEESSVDWPMEYFIIFYRLRQNYQTTAIQSNLEGELDSEVDETLLGSTRINQYKATHVS